MKKILTFLAVALVAAGSLVAQVPGGLNAGRPTSNTPASANGDIKVFAIELGTGFAYDLDGKASYATQTVSAIFGLTDTVQAGFSVLKGDTVAHSFSLVKIAVFPVTDLAIALDFGSTGASSIASGFGINYNIFRNTTAGLTTVLQGNVSYLFTDVAKGNLGLGLNLKVGL